MYNTRTTQYNFHTIHYNIYTFSSNILQPYNNYDYCTILSYFIPLLSYITIIIIIILCTITLILHIIHIQHRIIHNCTYYSNKIASCIYNFLELIWQHTPTYVYMPLLSRSFFIRSFKYALALCPVSSK